MKRNITKSKIELCCAAVIMLSASAVYAQTSSARQIPAGEKAKVTGTILGRHGDQVLVREKKSGKTVSIDLYEDTKIERRGEWVFRHPRMDVTAMVPGLTIEAEGVGNSKGELDARKVSFKPDVFKIEIAEEQQIMANQASAERAQSTASKGLETANAAQASAKEARSAAEAAQESADRAQNSANQADAHAQSAADLGVMDAAAAEMINRRVSELDDYKTVAEVSIYFGNDEATLNSDAKGQLSQLADVAKSLDGYMIEIAGYASTPGSRKLNQKLSEQRAAAVADYLLESKDVPIRRILAPAGYGATHAIAVAADHADQPIDRRVDVKVLLNKALSRAAE